MTTLNTQVEKLRNTVEGKLTPPFRPPSCDMTAEGHATIVPQSVIDAARDKRPTLKECPFCGSARTRYVRVAIKFERQDFHRTKCDECGCYGPIALNKHDAIERHNKRSIPRRSEVAELLMLVDEVTGWDDGLINQEEFDDGITMVGDIEKLRNHADRLRKGWKL